jgi:8-oxo-dGTP diphosphatase
MTNYVVGFMFSEDKQFVALIEKNRPAWQAGKLNGIGGKIEKDETPRAAMRREFQEETGVNTHEDDWTIVGRLEGPESRVYILRTFSDDVLKVQTTTDESVHLFIVDGIRDYNTVPNLQAIIPALLLPDLMGIFLTYY